MLNEGQNRRLLGPSDLEIWKDLACQTIAYKQYNQAWWRLKYMDEWNLRNIIFISACNVHTQSTKESVFFKFHHYTFQHVAWPSYLYKGHLHAWDYCLKVETWAPAPCIDWLSAIKLFSVRIRKILVVYQEGF